VGHFDVEAALRRHLAIPPCGIAATTKISAMQYSKMERKTKQAH
jgi:hypothetical protein